MAASPRVGILARNIQCILKTVLTCLPCRDTLFVTPTQTPGIVQHALHVHDMICLTDEADAAQRNIENKQRVYCDANTVPDHSRAAHDADSCCQRPCNENEIDGYPDNHGYADCAQERGDDEREERVADDRDGLEEGTVRVGLG